MRFLLAMAVIAISGTSWADRPGSPAQDWAGTDLDFELSKTFISNEKCGSSLTYFQSCVDAITAANGFLGEPVSLLANLIDFEKTLREIAMKLPQKTPVQQMLGAAINAHLLKFDAHAYLAPADSFQPKGNYFGVGMMVQKISRGFFVTEVVEGSAAAGARMMFGDVITGVPGLRDEDFLRLTVSELSEKLRGSAGTWASLSYERNGEKKSMRVRRGRVETKNVTYARFQADPQTAYVRIREFIPGRTCVAFKRALRALESQGVTKAVLDLRGNPGGSTSDAVCMAGYFAGYADLVGIQNVEMQIPESDLIEVFDPSKEIRWSRASSLETSSISLAILTDSETASAAELFAGSLQYYRRAWLVGERTFGKGTQQTYAEIPNHNSLVLAATTDRFFFPNLKSNQRVGLTPSFEVPLALGRETSVEKHGEAIENPTSLEAVNDAWEDARQDEIARIRGCIQDGDVTSGFLNQMGAASGDYPRAYAAAVLKCSSP